MTIDPPTLDVLLAMCLGGWSLYLSSERSRIVRDIKDLRRRIDAAFIKAETLSNTVLGNYLTKNEHIEFDNRISKSVDRLSDRIDRVLDQMVKGRESK